MSLTKDLIMLISLLALLPLQTCEPSDVSHGTASVGWTSWYQKQRDIHIQALTSALTGSRSNNLVHTQRLPEISSVDKVLLEKWIERDRSRHANASSTNTSTSVMSCYIGVGDSPGADDIDLELCTHFLLIGGASISGDGKLLINSNMLNMCRKLQARIDHLPPSTNPPLVMISLTSPSSNFSRIASTNSSRKTFSEQAVNVLAATKCASGIDLDWEFPSAKDFHTFPLLLQQIRLEMLKHKKQVVRTLSAAVAAPKLLIEIGYDVPQIGKWVDFINLMSYDYHFYRANDPLSWFTGHNSPLYARKEEFSYFATENTAWSSDEWVKRGLLPYKMLVGIPTYGHTYALVFSWMHYVHSPVKGSGSGQGWCSYSQICEQLKSGKMKEEFDEESQVPYSYSTTKMSNIRNNMTFRHHRHHHHHHCHQHDLSASSSMSDWWSYANQRSVVEKVEFVISRNYGGVMVFDLNSDDWKGDHCNQGRYPLTNAVHKALFNISRAEKEVMAK